VLGTLAFGVTALAPRPAAEGPRRLAARFLPEICLTADCEPGPPGSVDRVGAHFSERMPLLPAGERRRLARAVVVEAEAARVDPALVLAVIEVESSWQLHARSGRGAQGLMQLREPTLRREVERAGLDADDAAGDPALHVQLGIRYLRRLLDAFGREEVALMAYNAGPNRILGYLREGEIPERFRVYPRRVLAEARRLRRLWDEQRPVAAAMIGPPPEG
jgi:soluble lytic murein transglycosylase-like protein